MSYFNPSEIYQFAIKIEENGEKFYNNMAKKFKDNKISTLFIKLAKEEVGHGEYFNKLLSGFEDYSPTESYQGEYLQYLKAYADNLVFNFENFDKEVANIKTLEDAFQFAIKKEIDTVAYFREMKCLVPDGEKDKIETIIEEERRHVVLLTETRLNY